MNIRIGNDVKLNVRLYNPSETTLNILSVRAYLINETERTKYLDKIRKGETFVNRFPIEPISNHYVPTEYNINSTGEITYDYNVLPKYKKVYSGFGVYPKWEYILTEQPYENMFEYNAPVKFSSDSSVIQVIFPAEHQKCIGKYTLCVVYNIYNPGFKDNNIQTFTKDYNDVFELVDSSANEYETSRQIDIDNYTETIENIYLVDMSTVNVDKNVLCVKTNKGKYILSSNYTIVDDRSFRLVTSSMRLDLTEYKTPIACDVYVTNHPKPVKKTVGSNTLVDLSGVDVGDPIKDAGAIDTEDKYSINELKGFFITYSIDDKPNEDLYDGGFLSPRELGVKARIKFYLYRGDSSTMDGQLLYSLNITSSGYTVEKFDQSYSNNVVGSAVTTDSKSITTLDSENKIVDKIGAPYDFVSADDISNLSGIPTYTYDFGKAFVYNTTETSMLLTTLDEFKTL